MSLLLNSRGKEAHSGLVFDTTRNCRELVVLVISRYKSPRPLIDIEGSAEAAPSRVGPAVKEEAIEGHRGEDQLERRL
jgi:hypothetical protein